MSLALNIIDHWSDGKRIHVVGALVASGNYATGGDVVPVNNPLIKSTSTPVYVEMHGIAGYNYAAVAPNKMKIIVSSTGVELGAGAYPGGVTGDVISFYAIFPKIGKM